MGLFSNLMDKVFGKDEDSNAAASVEATATEAQVVEDAQPVETAVAPEPVALSEVDVVNLLDGKVEAHSEDLSWRTSIVDLLKLMELDSSYGARKEMAIELGYSAEDIESKGSAEMNMWLQKQVMHQIAKNGGNVPEELYA